MKFNKENLSSYYKNLQAEKGFPQAFLYELFLVGKLTRNDAIIQEIAEVFKEHGSLETNDAFTTRNKLPENGEDSVKILNTLLHYGVIDPSFPLGKMYSLLGFSSLSINDEAIAQKLEKHPELISLLNGVTKLKIDNVFTKGLPNEICDITSLTTLEIEGNYQYLPNNIGTLKLLEKSSLELPKLTSFPESFWSLKNIKELA
ncbi:MAG: hypothetical protein KKH44_09135 [Bacteroidetes bacterium]|nr:hypothetical protein [Bacteroidota bacterium]